MRVAGKRSSSMLGLALKNIAGSAFRSWIVGLCALVVAGLSLSTSLVVQGTQNSLEQGQQRMGADMVVVPDGVETEGEAALLMARLTRARLSGANVAKVRALPGVAAASPQLFLASLHRPSCCAISELFVVAIDPATDFTVQPWLRGAPERALGPGEAIVGSQVLASAHYPDVQIDGHTLVVRGILEPTGSALDQTLFVTFDTTWEMARAAVGGGQTMEGPGAGVSAILVRLAPGTDAQAVAMKIMQTAPEMSPVRSLSLYGSFRRQMEGLVRGSTFVLIVIWGLSLALVGLIFSMAANERWREVAVLRALGATRGFVFRFLLAEAALLALGGGFAGLALATLITYLLADPIVAVLAVPFSFPSLPAFLLLSGGTLILALAIVTLAALVPAWRASRAEPALAMRE